MTDQHPSESAQLFESLPPHCHSQLLASCLATYPLLARGAPGGRGLPLFLASFFILVGCSTAHSIVGDTCGRLNPLFNVTTQVGLTCKAQCRAGTACIGSYIGFTYQVCCFLPPAMWRLPSSECLTTLLAARRKGCLVCSAVKNSAVSACQ